VYPKRRDLRSSIPDLIPFFMYFNVLDESSLLAYFKKCILHGMLYLCQCVMAPPQVADRGDSSRI
jgi:hypothetical protein